MNDHVSRTARALSGNCVAMLRASRGHTRVAGYVYRCSWQNEELRLSQFVAGSPFPMLFGLASHRSPETRPQALYSPVDAVAAVLRFLRPRLSMNRLDYNRLALSPASQTSSRTPRFPPPLRASALNSTAIHPFQFPRSMNDHVSRTARPLSGKRILRRKAATPLRDCAPKKCPLRGGSLGAVAMAAG
jgi:hypothetical protein